MDNIWDCIQEIIKIERREKAKALLSTYFIDEDIPEGLLKDLQRAEKEGL